MAYGWFTTDDLQWFDEDTNQWFPNEYSKSIADGLALTCSGLGIGTVVVTLSDGLTIDDSTDCEVNVSVSISDDIILNDEASGAVKIVKSIYDSFNTSDTVLPTLNATILVSDGIGMSDTINAICTFVSTVTDEFYISETVESEEAIDTEIKFTFTSEGKSYNFIVKNRTTSFTSETRTSQF